MSRLSFRRSSHRSVAQKLTHGAGTMRRELQHAFVLALALVGMVSAVFMQRLTIHADPSLKVTFAGLALTGIFVLLWAASIEYLDEVFTGIAHGFSWAWLAEMVGIMSVAAGSTLYRANR